VYEKNMNKQLIECVPNFSEGRNTLIINEIANAIRSVEGIKLLNIDAGKAANRTVFTFVGEPRAVVQAAFIAIKQATALIDMSKQTGEHPRMGATDVCPFIPIANITMAETVAYARQLAAMVGDALSIPIYLYEAAATKSERRNLATLRSGEYESLPEKLTKEAWKPDFGPAIFNAKAGATVIGARDFLIAYNVNLNTTSVALANKVAQEVRESGYLVKLDKRVKVYDAENKPDRIKGLCKGVKAIGWYIEEYGVAQVSMNITDINTTPLHIAFEACCQVAEKYGMRVTGSELIGLLPKSVLLEAGIYFLEKQKSRTNINEAEIIKIAVKTLGLGELFPFDPQKRVIECLL
jgi:glutamate formiminotransferase / formiminotetrahydrofolate cyclodeaminase